MGSVSPGILANCTAVFRVPGGNITAQFPNEPGPAPKDLALTGGTRTYRNAGGDGTLVESARPIHWAALGVATKSALHQLASRA